MWSQFYSIIFLKFSYLSYELSENEYFFIDFSEICGRILIVRPSKSLISLLHCIIVLKFDSFIFYSFLYSEVQFWCSSRQVSVVIALLNRFDPYEYGARREEDNLPPGIHGNLGLRESLLFCFSGMTLQGEIRFSDFFRFHPLDICALLCILIPPLQSKIISIYRLLKW